MLIQAERRGRITSSQISTRLELITSLPITTDAETDGRAFREIITLARNHSLATYDAAYLDPVNRRGVLLATQDKDLVRAAIRTKVPTLPT